MFRNDEFATWAEKRIEDVIEESAYLDQTESNLNFIEAF